MLAEALALNWDEQEFTETRPGIFGATIETDQLTVTVCRYEPGCACEPHEHPEDQVTCVVEGGTIDFVIDGRPVPLTVGQLAVVPGHVEHAASVRADGDRVVTVNVWRLRPASAATS